MDEIGVGNGLMAQSFTTSPERKIDNDACVALAVAYSAAFSRFCSVTVEIGALYGKSAFRCLQRAWGPDAVQPNMPRIMRHEPCPISTPAHGLQRE